MRRTHQDIIHDLLNLIQKKGGKIKPTHLLSGGNLSYYQLKEYTKELMDRGFIESIEEKKKSLYSITDKGYKFLSDLKKIKELSDALGL